MFFVFLLNIYERKVILKLFEYGRNNKKINNIKILGINLLINL